MFKKGKSWQLASPVEREVLHRFEPGYALAALPRTCCSTGSIYHITTLASLLGKALEQMGGVARAFVV